MMRELTPDDFPLVAIGDRVYGKTQSSPILSAPTTAIAADLALRLNRDDCIIGRPRVANIKELNS